MHHARKRLGAIPLADTSGNKPLSELPENVDWRNNGIVSAVKDQGQCGSCWAFASTAVMESAVAKATGLLFDLSVQQMAMCAPNPDHCGGTGNCEGSTAELAYEYASKSGGILEEYMYSYGAYYGNVTACNVPVGPPKAAISGYKVLPANQMEPLMNAIANDGPLAVNVDANSWFAYSSGIFNGCDSAHPDIDHVVAIVGYGQNDQGKKFWLIRNSWSASWGEQGYMKLLRQDTQEEVDATCCTDVTPGNGIACENDLNPEHVCGTCGVLFDSVLPTGAVAL